MITREEEKESQRAKESERKEEERESQRPIRHPISQRGRLSGCHDGPLGALRSLSAGDGDLHAGSSGRRADTAAMGVLWPAEAGDAAGRHAASPGMRAQKLADLRVSDKVVAAVRGLQGQACGRTGRGAGGPEAVGGMDTARMDRDAFDHTSSRHHDGQMGMQLVLVGDGPRRAEGDHRRGGDLHELPHGPLPRAAVAGTDFGGGERGDGTAGADGNARRVVRSFQCLHGGSGGTQLGGHVAHCPAGGVLAGDADGGPVGEAQGHEPLDGRYCIMNQGIKKRLARHLRATKESLIEEISFLQGSGHKQLSVMELFCPGKFQERARRRSRWRQDSYYDSLTRGKQNLLKYYASERCRVVRSFLASVKSFRALGSSCRTRPARIARPATVIDSMARLGWGKELRHLRRGV